MQIVEALWLTESGPRILMGQLHNTTDKTLDFRPKDSGIHVPVGVRLLLYGTDINMLSTTVIKVENSCIKLNVEEHTSDKRLHPRLFGNIPVKLTKASEYNEENWLRSNVDISADWIVPEPFMNFSVNGLSFTLDSPLDKDSLYLVSFFVGSGTQEFRAVASVVRCNLQDNDYGIALYFEKISQSALAALSDFTLSIQEALLQQ